LKPRWLQAQAQALRREQADVAVRGARVPPAQRPAAHDLAVPRAGSENSTRPVGLAQRLQVGETATLDVRDVLEHLEGGDEIEAAELADPELAIDERDRRCASPSPGRAARR
jgi:hypothetical protein